MSLRVKKHKFTGLTTPITSYDYSKTCLGTLMTQNTGSNPQDKFVGPRPVSLTSPSLQLPIMNTGTAAVAYVSLYSTGTATVIGPAVTGSGTTWVAGHVGKLIGFGSTNPALITAWYVIATRGSGTAITLANGTTGTIISGAAYVIVDAVVTGASGASFETDTVGMSIGFGSTDPNAITNWYRIISRASSTSLTISGYPGTVSAGPYVIVTTMMYPHVITYSSTIDWVFLIENSVIAVANRRIFLYEYNKTTSVYTWKGYITANLNTSTAHTIRGFRVFRYLHTVGTVSASSTTVTGTGTFWQTENIAVGARIGFGSTDPTQITNWYVISAISAQGTITISTDAGTVVNGPYVIEELRFAIITTNATVASGGLFLVKGINYSDFVSGGTNIAASTGSTDNLKLVYWLSDAGTTANTVTNQVACGCAIQPEINKGLHYAYIIDGSTNAKVYRYNLRATGTITSGKMRMSISYYTTGTVTVSSGVVTGSGTTFTAAMVGMKIGFSTTSPALVTTWYTIDVFTDATHVTLSNLTVNVGAGASFIIDSADVLCTGNVIVAGTLSGVNNGRIGTLDHGPGKGVESLYFVTTTRIYRAAISNIYAGNLDWISDNRPEIPPGSVATFPATAALNVLEIADYIDRLIVLTTGATAFKHYITRYPEVAGDQFDRFFGVDDKQYNQSISDPNSPIHYNTISLQSSIWSQNGMAHIIRHGTSAAINLTSNQMYALPLSTHWSYSDVTDERIITPSISTPDCSSFKRIIISAVDHLGSEEFRLPTASILTFYRTNGISDNSGGWIQVSENGDLTGLSPASNIQFMFEFTTISLLCIPGRIMSLAVLYDDYSTDPHFQPSVGKTIVGSKQFAWRFATAFGTTIPTLRVRLFDAVTGGLIVDDITTTVGPWEKTTDGTNWVAYGTLADKSNEITYIRYTPVTLPDNIKIRALLTLY